MSTEKLALLRQINALFNELGLDESKRTERARALNDRNIKTMRKLSWTPTGLANWWNSNKHLLESEACDERDAHNSLDQETRGSAECEEHDAHNRTEGLYAEHAECDAHDERAECAAHNGDTESQEVISAESDERDAHLPWAEIEARMRRIATEVLENVRNEMNMNREISGQDLPPEPQYLKGQRGRRQDRTYKRLTLSVDINLAERFEDEMRQLNVSAGRLFDIILWQRYGKPKLSFEE